MDIATLILVFLSAVILSGCVVMAFSAPIDGALNRLLSGEMAAAWTRYAKFAVLVASFTGGMRLKELEALAGLSLNPSSQAAINMSKCLMEVYKTILGTLGAASWTLLVFFGATLTAYAGMNAYETFKSQSQAPRFGDRQHGAAALRS